MLIESLVVDLIMKRVSIDNTPIAQQRHICAIIKENGSDINVISVGYNIRFKVNNETYHAEEDALMKLKSKYKKISLVIIRISRSSNKEDYKLSMSKPCNNCVSLISNYKIKNVYYSTDNGIVKEKFKSILEGKQHFSKFRNK